LASDAARAWSCLASSAADAARDGVADCTFSRDP